MINFLTKEFFVKKIDRKGPTQIQLILTPDYWVLHRVCSNFTLFSQGLCPRIGYVGPPRPHTLYMLLPKPFWISISSKSKKIFDPEICIVVQNV